MGKICSEMRGKILNPKRLYYLSAFVNAEIV